MVKKLKLLWVTVVLLLTTSESFAGRKNLEQLAILPDEIVVGIFSYLSSNDLYAVSRVCKDFNELSIDVVRKLLKKRMDSYVSTLNFNASGELILPDFNYYEPNYELGLNPDSDLGGWSLGYMIYYNDRYLFFRFVDLVLRTYVQDSNRYKFFEENKQFLAVFQKAMAGVASNKEKIRDSLRKSTEHYPFLVKFLTP